MRTRREFLREATAWAALMGVAPGLSSANAGGGPTPFAKVVIAGKPRERGRAYGRQFEAEIRSFLDAELYAAFLGTPSPRADLLRYAGACAKEIRSYSPEIHEEIEGMAEGSGLQLEEIVLISLHEEMYHKGALPKVPHCTAVAAGPPDTTGSTYVGQTWDWMASVAGKSTLLEWRRAEGPSLLAYGYPGLWAGAGLSSAGLALCWTSADLGNRVAAGARIGIPSYVLLTHFLYQESLDAVAEEARRATHAGWFTFVMADANGRLLNVEGSPVGLAVEWHKGRLARVSFGSRPMTKAPDGAPIALEPRCQTMYELLGKSSGAIDLDSFRDWFQEPARGIANGSTLDLMVFDTTARAAHLSRGPGQGVAWQTFRFDAG